MLLLYVQRSADTGIIRGLQHAPPTTLLLVVSLETAFKYFDVYLQNRICCKKWYLVRILFGKDIGSSTAERVSMCTHKQTTDGTTRCQDYSAITLEYFAVVPVN